nr:serine/threonine-protein kinase/endoribonuclease ire1b [Quercus suber]
MGLKVLIFVLLLTVISSSLIGCLSESAITETSLSTRNLKALHSPTLESELVVVADLDGRIYLVDTGSRKILWSFASGQPIYSSYQAVLNNDKDKSNGSELSNSDNDFYIDCGDDWSLYLHKKSFKKVKIGMSAGDYLKNAPYISEDGGVTVGSKKTTVYLVDAKSGRLVNTYKLDGYPSGSAPQGAEENPVLSDEDGEELVEFGALNLETVEQPLYIMRTEYLLQHYSADNRKVLWNVTFSEFDAHFKNQKLESSFGGISPKSENEFSLEYGGDVDSQLLYLSKPSVLRIRDHIWLESLPAFNRLVTGLSGGSPLSLPAAERKSSSGAADLLKLAPPRNEGRQVLALPASEDENPGASVDENPEVLVTQGSQIRTFIPFLSALLCIMGVIFYPYLRFGEWLKLNRHREELNIQAGTPKKKKTRRSGNNKRSSNNQRMPDDISPENKVGDTKGIPHIEVNELKYLFDRVDVLVDGHRIGKLLVFNKEIAKGSNGTIVLEGIYDGRPVAVKRLVKTHHDVALKEIQNLIASDQHPNIVRCEIITKDQFSNFLDEHTAQLQSIKENNKNVKLWKENGHPTPQLLKLMRDVVSGLAHLHELGIIHRDLKPQNVLIIKERYLCAKISDMGISKRLSGDMSAFSQHATGCGSSGWQAPEQLLHRRQTRAVDLFSLGCVLFFCVTGGKHPYGDSIERDVNIVNDRMDLFLVENIPEAVDLFSNLLDPNPDIRPKATDVLHHPFFWDSEMRLSFLRDASDRVELEDRENESELLNALESIAAVALNGKWDEKMEATFLSNIGHYRRYKYDSIRDLLRVIRNKLNHYRELPQEIKELLGPVPEGFDSYFSSRFPKLLIEASSSEFWPYRVIDPALASNHGNAILVSLLQLFG